MRTRSVLLMTLLVLATGIATIVRGNVTDGRQTAILRLAHPTWVATSLLIGNYVIVHDDARMARGEPCTALYRVGAEIRPENEVVAFHCIPRARKAAQTFTVTIDSSLAFDADTLTEYQFAGDAEGHGVPFIMRVSSRSSAIPVQGTVCLR